MNTVFSALEVYTGNGYLMSTPSGVEPVPGARVTAGFFRVLGVTPLLGRDFYDGEDKPNASDTVMLTYATWQARFGGRKDIIGKTVKLDDKPNTIIGVLPANFQFAPRGNAEFWATLHTLSNCEKRRSCHNLFGVARLKDGVTVQVALAEMTSIAKQLEVQYPGSNRGQGASVKPLSEQIVGDIRPILLVLLGGAGLLLVIACVNVSSLLLVRSEARKREIAVRGALGASPTRLVRQFITEALVLTIAGAALGLLCAYGAMQVLTAADLEGHAFVYAVSARDWFELACGGVCGGDLAAGGGSVRHDSCAAAADGAVARGTNGRREDFGGDVLAAIWSEPGGAGTGGRGGAAGGRGIAGQELL